jgi:type VI secretion system protein ImpM
MSATMRCGLYGKLPAKRDFIAIGTTREFLAMWEAFMQGGVSASLLSLGTHWRGAFLTAPIWRFWLGAELCGATTLGAFMPSLDGIGRYFPLTVFVQAEEGGALAPPELNSQIEFFEAAEEFLLSTLEEGTSFEATTAALQSLRLPLDRSPPLRPGATFLSDGSLLLRAGDTPFADMFALAREAGHAQAYAASSFWWTAGGEGYPALALAKRRMPDPNVFTGMLTGNFESLGG